eukprot:TRINITY_DN8690_c0_g1_i1.p1 TRINITY_DN8690_c0_g1~~TRINITY_DN8690_c0_g1_i1.p1  ORF type:complete len:397 (-),score=67.78 TRINITY_DN8690_c0_g1_i1:63-1253(-)
MSERQERRDDEDENDATEEQVYFLGYVRPLTSEETPLTSMFFPSKVGGHPAWLDPVSIPTPDEMRCTKCGKQMAFLLQLYAPFEEYEHSFHRTVFVFCCKDSACNQDASGFKILRSQLPRRNDYYPDTPIDRESCLEEEDITVKIQEKQGVHLCPVCGCRATFLCGRCKSVRYCGPEHQRHHWSNGHKADCAVLQTNPHHKAHTTIAQNAFTFLEFEIETEAEDSWQTLQEKMDLEDSKTYGKYLENTTELTEEEEEDLEETAESMGKAHKDKAFYKFQKLISINPDQCIRYGRFEGARPVWVSEQNQTRESDIPPCESCGGQRVFEFQILPQLLYFLQKKEDPEKLIDFGTLVIYSCSKSCQTKPYQHEFIWRQNIPIPEEDKQQAEADMQDHAP